MKKLLLVVATLSLGLISAFGSAYRPNDLIMAKADAENVITIDGNDNYAEGQNYGVYVYITTYDSISALSLELHFDDSVLTVNNTQNAINASIYDSSIHDDYISYSYIFDDIGLGYAQTLFYFSFTIDSPVAAGEYYFDVVVNEAYNSSFESVSLSAQRKYFNVLNQTSLKSAYASLNNYSTNTSINNEFSFSYYLDTKEPSSGNFIVAYDDELFEFVSLTKGHFFDNMIFDYNSNLIGQISISFAAVSQAESYDLFTITLRTIANVDDSSSIQLNSHQLYDNDMNPMSFNSSSFTVNIQYDSSLDEDVVMTTNYEVDNADNVVTLTIVLGANSRLGAGDFVLTFDKDFFTYVSYTQKFSPTFFTVNDKATQLEKGQVKFSILSTTDIVNEVDVVSFRFSYGTLNSEHNASFTLTGSGLTDSLTQPITLNISGVAFTIPATDLVANWANIYLHMKDDSFNGDGSGKCLSEGLYALAKQELLKLGDYNINSFRNNVDNRYTASLARYLAWATACQDDSPFEVNINGAQYLFYRSNNQNQALVIFGSIVASLMLTILGLSIIKRRKFDNEL